MCAIGCAVIEKIQKGSLIDRSQRLGIMLKNMISDCGIKHHAGKGLMAGIEFENAKIAAKVAKQCKKNNLWVVDTGRKWVKIGPPLTIDEDQLEQGCAILKDSINKAILRN